MIAAWILYCALWALWLSAVAWVTERMLLDARGPVRMVWLSAMLLSVLGPVLGYALPRSAPSVAGPALAMPVVASRTDLPLVTRMASSPVRRLEIGATLRVVATRVDRPLAAAWIAIAFVLVLYIGGGVLRLRLLRRRWHPRVLAGTPVMISDDTGPALVGVFNSTIVIPAWALELEPAALALMLRHEVEHRDAGDTRTLALAQALLVLMPWNPMMWWQLRRLRLAIELDCDARVLRSAATDVGAYGRLLLEFGQPRRNMRISGAALADHRASQLETRIRRMTRSAPMPRRRVVAFSAIATAIAIVIGCQLPTPPAPVPLSNTTSPNELAPLLARLDSAISPTDTAARAVARALRARLGSDVEREREGKRRRDVTNAELERAMREGRFSSDSLDALFAQIAKTEVAARNLLQKQLEASRRDFDSLSAKLPRWNDSVQRAWPREDSLLREFARLSTMYTNDHPKLRQLLDEYAASPKVLTDSLAALEPGPACTVGPGEQSIIKLVVSNDDVSRLGRVVVNVVEADHRGSRLEYGAGGMMCQVTGTGGEIRLYGRGAFDGTPILVRSSIGSSLIVVTGSGRVLVGPTTIKNETRRLELTWQR